MAIVFDNGGGTSGNVTALNLTLTAGSNATLIVCAGNVLGRSVSAMAYGGVALTKFAQVPTSLEMWVLTAPAAGSNVLSAQFTGAVAIWSMVGMTYTGVQGAAGIAGPASATITGATNVNLSISSSATFTTLGFFRANSAGAGVTVTLNNGTTRASANATGDTYIVGGDIAGAAAITISATCSVSVNWQMLGVYLIPSAAAAAATRQFNACLTGAGY